LNATANAAAAARMPTFPKSDRPDTEGDRPARFNAGARSALGWMRERVGGFLRRVLSQRRELLRLIGNRGGALPQVRGQELHELGRAAGLQNLLRQLDVGLHILLDEVQELGLVVLHRLERAREGAAIHAGRVSELV